MRLIAKYPLNSCSMQNKFLKYPILVLLMFFMSVAKANTYTVINTSDVGAGSFREAINQANTHIGPDTIKFQIAGTGDHIIQPVSALPLISDTIFFDGFSQSGLNIHNIIIDGSLYPPTSPCILINNNSSFSRFEGIIFKSFTYGVFQSTIGTQYNQIVITNCKFINNPGFGFTINGFINSEISFTEISGNGGHGINLTQTKKCIVKYNSIHDNNGDGILIQDNSTGNIFQKNKSYNNAGNGFFLNGANGSNIIQQNNIYSNNNPGIFISTNILDSILIEDNLIGSDSAWNNKGNNGFGIFIGSNGHKKIYVKNNIIGYNKSGGIFIYSLDSINIVGNHIGTNSLGGNLGNSDDGIKMVGNSAKILIGDGTASGANNIAYNNNDGIENLNGQGDYRQNLFYNNGNKAINLGTVGTGIWGNNSKKTPYISNQSYNDGKFTLIVNSETTDKRIEIYKSDGSLNAIQFITDTITQVNGNIWQTTFSWPNPNESFVLTATGLTNNTSEFGFSIAKCLTVTNTNDEGFGSLRSAIGCANAFTDTSVITFNIHGIGPHIIKPNSELPRILYSTILDGFNNDNKIVLDGSNVPLIRGCLIFGADPFGAPALPGYKSSSMNQLKIINYKGAIYAEAHDVLKITNSDFQDDDAAAHLSLLNDTLIIDNCNILKCKTSFTRGISGSYNTKKIYLLNSIIDSCDNGINMFQEGQDLIVQNNSITNSTADGLFTNLALSSIQITNNHISGNKGVGINISSSAINNVLIKGNIIGLTKDKAIPMPNGAGIRIRSSKASIDSNIISGNLDYGITNVLFSSLKISRNYIGTNANWDNLGNGSDGIYATNNSGNSIIGGNTLDSANIIGYNKGYGINLAYGIIQNNYVGVSRTYENIGNYKSGVMKNGGFAPIRFTGNFIGFNQEHGVENGSYNIFNYNLIGGDSLYDFGNKKWGIKNFNNAIAKGNYIANNDSGGVSVNGSFGKLSQNLFHGDQPKAISHNGGIGNNNQQAATFSSFSQTPSMLTLTGGGIDNDTVEVFLASPTPETAKLYVGNAHVSDGAWSLNIPKGEAYDFQQDAYYVNTATSETNNTSELGSSFLVPVYLCGTPNANKLIESVKICHGDSILIDAGINNVIYRWFYNNQFIASSKILYIKNTGDYRLELEDSYGCISRDTVSLIENPHPTLPKFLMSSEAGKGDKVVVLDISQANPSSLSWDFGNAQVMQVDEYYVLIFEDTGNHVVTLTSHLDQCTISVTQSINIVQESLLPPGSDMIYPYVIKDVKIGPNPNNGIFNITTELAREEKLTVEIINFMGTVVQRTTSENTSLVQTINVNMDTISAGIYTIRVYSNKDSRIFKIIKE